MQQKRRKKQTSAQEGKTYPLWFKWNLWFQISIWDQIMFDGWKKIHIVGKKNKNYFWCVCVCIVYLSPVTGDRRPERINCSCVNVIYYSHCENALEFDELINKLMATNVMGAELCVQTVAFPQISGILWIDFWCNNEVMIIVDVVCPRRCFYSIFTAFAIVTNQKLWIRKIVRLSCSAVECAICWQTHSHVLLLNIQCMHKHTHTQFTQQQTVVQI